jgi:hypothetical protein
MITYEADKVDIVWECTDEDCECDRFNTSVPVQDIPYIGVPICPEGLDMEPLTVRIGAL